MKIHTTRAHCFFKTCSTILLLIFNPADVAAQFTSGSLVVLQANNGVTTQTNTGNPIVLKEFSNGGTAGFSFTVPTTGANALVMSGSAGSEGYLSLSADNRYLVFGGYNQSLPNSTPLPGATASAINRGIGMVSGTGSYSLVATSLSFFSTGNIRGAAAMSNLKCWGTGSSQGTNYFGPGSPVTVQNTKTNLRAVNIFNNQLYCSAQLASGTPTDVGVYQVGTGTPTVAGQAASCIIVTGAASQPGQFFFNSTSTICYVADSRNSALGGVQKWVNSAGTWTLAYTLPTGTAPVGAFGVVADFSGSVAKVYATTSESGTNRLVAIADIGATATATTIASATAANTHFRGLAFAPCSVPVLTATGNSTICANQTLSLNATPAGTAAVTYTWSGVGAFNATTSATPLVSGAATGVYTVTAGNTCGTADATLAVIVNPLPAVTVNSMVVCTGQPATLTAAGASTYLWSTGAIASSVVVTPLINTVYTVTGTSAAGCIKAVTSQVISALVPTVTLNSTGYCSGGSAILTAGGANSFTWSTGAMGSSLVVSPAATANYTVSGSLAGCAGTSSAVGSVLVWPSPSITIGGETLTCAGAPVILAASGADNYAWGNGAVINTISVMPVATTVYTVTGVNNTGSCSAATSHTVILAPLPTLTVTATPTLLCSVFSTATLTASGASTYSWSNGTIAADNYVSSLTVGVKNYTVIGFITPRCFSSGQVSIRVVPCVGLEDNKKDETFSLYPNPAGSEVKFTFENNDERLIQVTNALGQPVLYKQVYDRLTGIDTGELTKGIYVVIVTHKGLQMSMKLVIE